jgi:outer membrane protein OmpA-like peptidoglycan-associated protein
MTILVATTGTAAAQDDENDNDVEQPGTTDVSGIDPDEFIVPVEATILPLRATISDLDGGTATTESTEDITVTLEADVFFDFDESDLRSDALDTLTEVAEQIDADGATEVHISGHTDSVGDAPYNQALSEDRAESVEAFLAGELDGVSFTTEGHGADHPVAPNETEDGDDFEEGRARNRRVEITYPQPG